MCVELLLFHEQICSVTKVEISHDDPHPAEGLERCLLAQGHSCSRWLLLKTLHVLGNRSAVAVVAKHVEDQKDHSRAQEETRRQFLEEVGGWQRLAAGAVDGLQQFVAHRVHEDHCSLAGRLHRVVNRM